MGAKITCCLTCYLAAPLIITHHWILQLIRQSWLVVDLPFGASDLDMILVFLYTMLLPGRRVIHQLKG